MVSSGFFQVFIIVGLVGAWITFLFCIYVTVREYRSGTIWKARD